MKFDGAVTQYTIEVRLQKHKLFDRDFYNRIMVALPSGGQILMAQDNRTLAARTRQS